MDKRPAFVAGTTAFPGPDDSAGTDVSARADGTDGIGPGAAHDTLSPRRRGWRWAAALVVAALVLTGTLWGQDDDFPFAPFRMYATRDDPHGVVRILHVEVTAADGSVHDVTDASGAPRRAEMEGRIPQLRDNPELLRPLATAYSSGVSSPTSLTVVWREYRLVNGRSTPPTDVVLAQIPLPGGAP